MIDPDEITVPDREAWAQPPPDSGAAKGERHLTITAVGDIDAAQTGRVDFGRPPRGYRWKVERATFVVPGLAGDTVLWLVFVGQVQNDSLKDFAEDVIGAANRTSRVIGEWVPPIRVPTGRALIATVADADAAGQAVATVDLIEEPD